MDTNQSETANNLALSVEIQPPTPPPTPPYGTGPSVGSPLTQPPAPPSYTTPSDYRFPSSKSHFGLITAFVFLIIVIIATALYFWLLPLSWSNSYLKTIKPLYENQAAQMNTVYQSISRGVFTNNQSSSSSDAADLQYIASSIQSAVHATDALKTANHLTVLPATNWLHTVNTATTDYQSMQQYVSDSQTFLFDYSDEVTYMQDLTQLAQTLFPPIANDLNAVNKGSADKTAFMTTLQSASSDIQNFVNKLKTLKPSSDLSGYNQSLLSSLTNMSGALSAQETDLQNNDAADFNNQRAVYASAFENFVSLLNSNPTANIQTSSTIEGRITNLKSEHPIQ